MFTRDQKAPAASKRAADPRPFSRVAPVLAVVGALVPGVLGGLLAGKSKEVMGATYSAYFMLFMGVVAFVFAKRGMKRIARLAVVAGGLAAVLFVVYLYLVYVRG